MAKDLKDETWGDVTEREVALYAIYELLHYGLEDESVGMFLDDSIYNNYPNLNLDGARKKKVFGHLKKNLCRLERAIVKSLEAYDYELKNCDSE